MYEACFVCVTRVVVNGYTLESWVVIHICVRSRPRNYVSHTVVGIAIQSPPTEEKLRNPKKLTQEQKSGKQSDRRVESSRENISTPR